MFCRMPYRAPIPSYRNGICSRSARGANARRRWMTPKHHGNKRMISESKATMKKQVLIVGAGPVGLTMAAELARYGVPVRIVDKAAQRTDKSKAIVLWSRTLELLDRARCAETSWRPDTRSTPQTSSRATDDGSCRLHGVDSPYPFALMLPQSETERLLEERLIRLGVRSNARRDDGASRRTGVASRRCCGRPTGWRKSSKRTG